MSQIGLCGWNRWTDHRALCTNVLTIFYGCRRVGTEYPFYAVQYHPEKNIFEWNLHTNVNHQRLAVQLAQALADFFVEEGAIIDRHPRHVSH